MDKQELAQIKAKHNTQYQIRPHFKDKFRPAEAKAAIERILPELVIQEQKRAQQGKKSKQKEEEEDSEEEEESDWKSDLGKVVSQRVKETLVGLNKDERYKYIVQTTVGENNG